MTRKRVLTPPSEKKRFPKPTGRIGSGLIDKSAEDAQVVQDNPKPMKAEVEVLHQAPVPSSKTISITIDGTKSHIDLGGMTLVDGIAYIRNAHKFLMNELIKAMQIDDNETGAADPASGSNT